MAAQHDAAVGEPYVDRVRMGARAADRAANPRREHLVVEVGVALRQRVRELGEAAGQPVAQIARALADGVLRLAAHVHREIAHSPATPAPLVDVEQVHGRAADRERTEDRCDSEACAAPARAHGITSPR
jgi:hypothetical protein